MSTDAEAMIVDEMLSTMKQVCCVCLCVCVRVCVWRVSDCLQRGAGGEGRLEATEREKATEKPSQLPSQTLEEALNETVTQLATVHVL